MIIIAFCTKTSKSLPRIVCKHFKHCAPILSDSRTKKSMVMYQFVKRHKIVPVYLNARDLNILRAHGWVLICITGATPPPDLIRNNDYSCVSFTKRVCGVHNILIQTPDALYKHLRRLNTI